MIRMEEGLGGEYHALKVAGCHHFLAWHRSRLADQAMNIEG